MSDLHGVAGGGGVKKWVQPAIPRTQCWPLSCYFSARAEAPRPPGGASRVFWGASVPQSLLLKEKECGLAGWLGSRRSFRAGRGRGRLKRGLLLVLRSLLLHSKALPPTFRPCSHVLGALTPRKPMGSPGLAALLLPLLLLLTGLSACPGIACPSLSHWSTRCLLASHMVRPRRRVGTPSWHGLVKLPTLLPVLPYLSSPCALGAASVCPLHGLKGVAKVLVH